ncbi:hypothetical protein [Piscinibacter defluvii]|uniref:hypothetical protein n=1 Tax=Piscinibacter defluvii TaxID=1796922 RepID=UPI000FDF3793|nr:hypothetical protein [Piscinibacter defluvii]
MPHEFRNLSSLSHGELGLMLVGGLASAAVIIGLALVLAWKNRRRSADGSRPPQPKPRKAKRRKRR